MVHNIEKEICKSSAAIMQRVVLFSKYLRLRSIKDRFVSETHHQNGKQEWIHMCFKTGHCYVTTLSVTVVCLESQLHWQ